MSEIVFDIETEGLFIADRFLGMAYAEKMDEVLYTDDYGVARSVLKEAMKDGLTLVGHNIVSFDLPKMLWEETHRYRDHDLRKLVMKATIRDTLVESRRLFPEQAKHGMEYWSERLCGEYDCKPKVVVEDFRTASRDLVRERAMEDVKAEASLADYFRTQLQALDVIEEYEFEQKWFRLCIEMVSEGIPIEMEMLPKLAKGLEKRKRNPEALLETYFPGVNFRSTVQVEKALRERYGAGLPKKRSTGNPTMDKRLSAQIKAKFPLMRYHYKAAQGRAALDFLKPKAKSAKYLGNYVAKDYLGHDRVYPKLKYVGTRTGRMQYGEPPIQQLPKQGVREAIIADDGWCLVGMDVVALEISWMAKLLSDVMGEERMLEQLKRGDCPKKLTLEAFKDCLKDVQLYGSQTMEDVAKMLNYAIPYGIGMKTIMYTLNMPDSSESLELIATAIEERMPSMRGLERVLRDDMDGEVLKGYYGTPVLTEPRNALNSMVQNSGADYARRVMLCWWEELKKSFGEDDVRAVIYNMDELQCMVRLTDSRDTEEVREICETITLWMPEAVKESGCEWVTGIDVKVGENWAATH